MLTWWKVSSICYTVLFGFTISILHFICLLAHSRFLFFFSFAVVWFRFFVSQILFYFLSICTNMAFHPIRLAVRATSSLFFSAPHDGDDDGDEEWRNNKLHSHTETLAKVMTKSMVGRDREIKRQRGKKNQQQFHTKCLLFSVLLCWLTIVTYEDTTYTQLLLFDLAVLLHHLGGNVNKQTHTHIQMHISTFQTIKKSLVSLVKYFVVFCRVLFLSIGDSIWIQNTSKFMNHDKCDFSPNTFFFIFFFFSL